MSLHLDVEKLLNFAVAMEWAYKNIPADMLKRMEGMLNWTVNTDEGRYAAETFVRRYANRRH